jgi:hypothetical protein
MHLWWSLPTLIFPVPWYISLLPCEAPHAHACPQTFINWKNV